MISIKSLLLQRAKAVIHIVNLGSIKAQRKVLQLISSHEMEIGRNVVKHCKQITMSQAKPAMRTEVLSRSLTRCYKVLV